MQVMQPYIYAAVKTCNINAGKVPWNISASKPSALETIKSDFQLNENFCTKYFCSKLAVQEYFMYEKYVTKLQLLYCTLVWHF